MGNLVDLGLARAIVDDVIDPVIPPTIYMISEDGERYIEYREGADREKRWTRGLAIAAIVISVLALLVSVLSNYDKITSSWSAIITEPVSTVEESHSQVPQDTIP